MNETKNNVNALKAKKVREYITVGIFLVVVMGISMISMFKPDKKFSENENRVLASKPEISIDKIMDGSFTSAYETYITDQFIGRDQFIATKVYTELAMGKKVVNGVYFAPENYLIEEHKQEDIEDTLATTNLQRVKEFIDINKNKMNTKLMLVPTASNIYSEWLPKFNDEYNQSAFIEQAKETIGDEALIDVSKILKNHKEDYIFYRTDHHWTSLGAYYAYIDWANSMGLSPYTLAEFDRKVVSTDFWGTTYSKVNIKKEADCIELWSLKDGPTLTMSLKQDGSEASDSLYNMERLQQKDKYTVFLGGNNSYVEIHTSVANGKTLLVMMDSYAHCLVPFLSNHYENIILLDYRYYNKSTKRLIEDKNISDVLIIYNVINFTTDTSLAKINK